MSTTRGLQRSIRLFSSFRLEQSDPDVFYSAIAEDSISLIEDHQSVTGALLLDVGAGREQFALAFTAKGASYVAIDPDVSLLDGPDAQARRTVVGDGYALPFAAGVADIAFSSNVLEHVADPARFISEMVRVTRPGGLVVVSYTNWLGPWGGHETAPFHYLGGYRAARRFARRNGRPPKNNFGVSLFPISVADGLRLAHSTPDTELVDTRPRYHPDWARWVLRAPGVRELVTWNLWFVLRRT